MRHRWALTLIMSLFFFYCWQISDVLEFCLNLMPRSWRTDFQHLFSLWLVPNMSNWILELMFSLHVSMYFELHGLRFVFQNVHLKVMCLTFYYLLHIQEWHILSKCQHFLSWLLANDCRFLIITTGQIWRRQLLQGLVLFTGALRLQSLVPRRKTGRLLGSLVGSEIC